LRVSSVGLDGRPSWAGELHAATTSPSASIPSGRVVKVIFAIAYDVYIDVERKLAAAVARD
jgi:hypothetical protein